MNKALSLYHNVLIKRKTTEISRVFSPYLSVAAANGKGFAVANFLLKHIIVVHPTVSSDGVQSRSIGR